MKADQNSGIANLVKQGDRVDVDAYFTKNELFPETKTMNILAGVKVFAIDGKTKHDPEAVRTRSARTISLAIRNADHEAWMLAQRNGEVSLSLGSPGNYSDNVPEDEASPSGQNFLTWMADHRAEQERLAAEAKAKAIRDAQVEPADALDIPPPKKNTFRQVVMSNGRMKVYEWTEGSPVPKIIADTGLEHQQHDIEPNDQSTSQLPTNEQDELSHLNGDESPFFQPGS
jgi:pilus assembly protein CpaB